MCGCAGGFSGANCECECIECEQKWHTDMSGISIACSFTGDPIYIQCIQLCTYNTIIIDVVEAHCYLVDTRAN